MDIRICISELLEEHDCVIIPGFGGFIGNYAPARIDPVNHTFHPPTKQLLFNVNLKHNDGLLATYVSRLNGSSYADACKLVEDFSEVCTGTIHAGENLEFPRIGHLFTGNEGNIQFEQHKTVNLLPDSYGLCSFISPPVNGFNSMKPVVRKHMRKPYTGNVTYRLNGLLRWAAILALPLGIAAVTGVMQYDKITSKMTSNAGVLSSVFSRFSSASLFEKKSVPAEKNTYVPKKVLNSQPASETVDLQTSVTETASITTLPSDGIESSDAQFAVIIGAFRMRENAEKLISELKSEGVDASIFDRSKSGLYRVTLGKFSQREEALQLLASAQATKFEGAWLLAK